MLAHQHVLNLPVVIAVGLLGVSGADWIIYVIGRRYGMSLVEHPRLARLVGTHRIAAVRQAVEHHGARAVFFARFMFGFRIATFFAAGTFGVSAVRFGMAEAASTTIFVPAMVTLGFLFSDRAERLARNASRAQHWVVLVGLLGLGIYLALRALTVRTGLGEGPIIPPPAPPRDAAAGPPSRRPHRRPRA